MKNSLVRVNKNAEGPQTSSYNSPTDYASDKAQGTARSVTRETVYQVWEQGKNLFRRDKIKLRNDDKPNWAKPKTAERYYQSDAPNETATYTDTFNNAKNDPPHNQQSAVKLVRKDTTFQTVRLKSSEISAEHYKAIPSAKPNTPFSETYSAPTDKVPNATKGSTTNKSYPNAPPKSVVKSALPSQAADKTGKSTKRGFKQTAKGTVKTTQKSVKTAEVTAKTTVKTSQQSVKTAQTTAKATQKAAQATVKAAKAAAQAAHVAAKAAVTTAKAVAKAVSALVKSAVAAAQSLAAAIVAGGWVAALVIIIICIVGLIVGSVFGIFFSGEPNEGGQTINSIIAEIDNEYMAQIDGIIAANAHDLVDMSGARASWKEVLAVYSVKTTTDPDNPMEVATVNGEKAALLRSVFWEMNSISHSLDSVDVEEDVLDANDLPTGETVIVSKTVLTITVSHKTLNETSEFYHFNVGQEEQLAELLNPDYYGLWNALLYGITSIGDGTIIEFAASQIGNIGGETYWTWYGLSARVEWCAIFVSWSAEQCGYIEAGVIPKFASCSVGIQWFKGRELWFTSGYTPSSGDLIFFDWDADAASDHVGIVERVENGIVHTFEGNTRDSVARRSYALDSAKIVGYGVPDYR
jgi:hypothetical protein